MLIDINKFKKINKMHEKLSSKKTHQQNIEVVNQIVSLFTEITAAINESFQNLLIIQKKLTKNKRIKNYLKILELYLFVLYLIHQTSFFFLV